MGFTVQTCSLSEWGGQFRVGVKKETGEAGRGEGEGEGEGGKPKEEKETGQPLRGVTGGQSLGQMLPGSWQLPQGV